MIPQSTSSSQIPEPPNRPASSSKAQYSLLLLLLLGISAGTATVTWMEHESVKNLLASREAAAIRRPAPTVANTATAAGPRAAATRTTGARGTARGNRGANGGINRILVSVTDLSADQTAKLTDLYTQRQQAVTAGEDPADLDSQISTLVGPDDFAVIQPLLNAAPAQGRRGRGAGGGRGGRGGG